MIRCDPHNPTAVRLKERLEADLPSAADSDELIYVIGGDGFLLQCVREHGTAHTYLGLNAGRVGFLLNDVRDWATLVGHLRAGAWRRHRFPMLSATLHAADGSRTAALALNDVTLERASGQTAHLGVSIDDREVVHTLVADGLIFATALGSTAYNISAGGPACHPTLHAMCVTAICPHQPRLVPFLLPEGAVTRVEVRAPKRRPVRAVADGHGLVEVVAMDVTLGPSTVALAWVEGHDFTEQMVRKTLREPSAR